MNKFPNDLIPLGKIIKPHGIKGQIKFKPYNQSSSTLIKNMTVWLKKEDDSSLDFKFFKISSIIYSSLQPIIKLEKIDDRNGAIDFRDYILYISRSSFPSIRDDDLYFVDLIGCKVYDKHEELIGVAKDIVHFSENNHVIIIGSGTKEFMAPISRDLVRFFDIKKKYVMIDIADGLVEHSK